VTTEPQRTSTIAEAPSYRLFVASRDGELRRALRERLRDPTVELREVDDPERAVDLATDSTVDFAVLELSGYCALDTIRRVRSGSRVPILALVDTTVDCVDAIDVGADDYLRLPCSAREIEAKIRSAFRRANWRAPDDQIFVFEELSIDLSAREVRIGGRTVPMPLREFDLLAFLASSPRHVFTRIELLEHVWHASSEWLGTATVTEHVRRLRMRLAVHGATRRYVRTVRGAGYRFDPGDCVA
jgi:two-component system, OmpR family, phosphate regulon response regulator PhoB